MSILLPKTLVVNIHFEEFDVYIGRAGKGKDGYFGNPFILAPGADRIPILKQYESWFYARIDSDLEFKQRVHKLKGKRLGCFCSPKHCHGHIIADYLDWEVWSNNE